MLSPGEIRTMFSRTSVNPAPKPQRRAGEYVNVNVPSIVLLASPTEHQSYRSTVLVWLVIVNAIRLPGRYSARSVRTRSSSQRSHLGAVMPSEQAVSATSEAKSAGRGRFIDASGGG